jgi:molybdopterin converting factor subunit 1
MFMMSSMKLLCVLSQLFPDLIKRTNGRTIGQTACPLVPSPHAGYNRPVPSASQSIRVKVLFFGRLKEIAGLTQAAVDLPADANIESLFARYASRYPELQQYRSSLVASCNQEFAAWNTVLHAGDEVAFLPPVSGG